MTNHEKCFGEKKLKSTSSEGICNYACMYSVLDIEFIVGNRPRSSSVASCTLSVSTDDSYAHKNKQIDKYMTENQLSIC